ncbi:DciA family protein [Frankia sp. AgPm24]|uniref:DUF721 domain-containing protein n=1 Tax=Frankia sp. AgPm24 TaxID=631128 RepID=UPI00200F4533|nr:DciA family protein [Frankia sp. AgPm24]MCK9920594.1 DciA family protein [Frankia sp. AgPm24]
MPADPPEVSEVSPAAAAAAAARGADLARQVLAQAKQDARDRARGRRPTPDPNRSGAGGGQAGQDRDAAGGVTGAALPGGSGGRFQGGGGVGGRRRADDDGQPPRLAQLPGIARPGRQWREPLAFGSAIGRLLASRGWREQAADASVLSRWDVIVGPDIAERCTPVSLRDGQLELVAESTAWATQMRMLAPQILAILHRELGPRVVQRITVRGPTAPSWRHGSIRTGGRGPRDTYG